VKILFICIAGIALLILAAGFVLGVKSKQSPPLGLVAGHLRPCPASPNCVSSEAQADDEQHYIAPFRVKDSGDQAWLALVNVIRQTGSNIETNDGLYLHATFTSTLFRFVDDLEAWMDHKTGIVHIRSASRVGYSDLGANRRRVETIRRLTE